MLGVTKKGPLMASLLLIKLEITVILLSEIGTPGEAPAGESWTCLPCFGNDVEMQRQKSLMFGLPRLTNLGREQ